MIKSSKILILTLAIVMVNGASNMLFAPPPPPPPPAVGAPIDAITGLLICAAVIFAVRQLLLNRR